MARGMVEGEPINSQASTDEYRSNYERTFGDKPVQRGRWIWDEAAQKLVRAEDYRPPERAVDAPIMMDRHYEGLTTHDGKRVVDIGSRRKHQAYMKAHGLAMAQDYKQEWARAEKKREDRRNKLTMSDPSRRPVLERAFYELSNGKKRQP